MGWIGRLLGRSEKKVAKAGFDTRRMLDSGAALTTEQERKNRELMEAEVETAKAKRTQHD